MTAPTAVTPRLETVAVIGFGEVGRVLARGFAGGDGPTVRVFDRRLSEDAAMADAARDAGAAAAADLAKALERAQLVISAVTAGAAQAVAEAAAGHLAPGALFLDLNSISPAGKAAGAAAIGRSGARYVEGAIMSPVGPHGHRVPILLSGPDAADAVAMLAPFGMRVSVAGIEVGAASAVKMCRSIMMKGMEALAVECLTAARRNGIENAVLASLYETLPGIDWRERCRYMITRVAGHGARRAEEMQAAAVFVAESGLSPVMSEAVAARQRAVAELPLDREALLSDGVSLETLLDSLLAAEDEEKGQRK